MRDLRSMKLPALPSLACGAVTLLLTGCGAGEKCAGGVTNDAGECFAKCQPELCVVLPGDGGPVLSDGGVPVNACVDNTCMLRCDSHRDCTIGTESCLEADEDGDAGVTNVCQPSGHAGILDPCPAGNSDCLAGLVCNTRGEGDGEAYCTIDGCMTDDECPAGLYCGVVRDPHQICGTIKGDDYFCGETTEACIDASILAACSRRNWIVRSTSMAWRQSITGQKGRGTSPAAAGVPGPCR